MSYDIYGTWDATIASIGDHVYASTNLTMIDSGLQLLWHNNIPPSQVNLGLGYYGRSTHSCPHYRFRTLSSNINRLHT